MLSSGLNPYYERACNFRTSMGDNVKIKDVNSAPMYTMCNSSEDKGIMWFIDQNVFLIFNRKPAAKKDF